MKKLGISLLVSVIIPTCNSQRTIEKCLNSVRRQTHKNTETLVVDNFSTDKTASIAKRFGAKVLSLRSERSAARNYGAQEAGGEFLLFIDSDMELQPEVIEECLTKCTEDSADAVIIPEKYMSQGLIGLCRETEKQLLTSRSDLMEIPRFFRRNIFLRLGGFDEKLVCGEDFDFFQRFNASGYTFGKIEAQLLHFEHVQTFYDVATKGYGYGKTLVNLMEKAPKNTVRRYGILRMSSVKKIGSETRSLKVLFVFVFMKVVEYLSYSCGLFSASVEKSFVKKGFDRFSAGARKKSGFIAGWLLLFLVALVVFRNFFFTNGLPGGNDTFGWVSREYIFARNFRWLYVWRPYSFGFVEGINLMDLFFMITDFAFTDAVATIKVFLFLCFLLAGFSMHAFAYRYTHSSLAALSAGLVYVLNQWFFSQLTEGHVDLVFSYAFAPLLFLLVDRALVKGGLKNLILSSLGLAVFLAGFHANSVVIYGFFLALFLVVYLLFPSRKTRLVGRGRSLLKFLAVCGVAVFLLTAFFTVPFFMNVKAYFMTEEYKYQIEEAESFSASNLVEAFALGATEEGGYLAVVDVRQGFGITDFPVQAFLFVIFLVCYCAILFRRDRYTIFFLAATIVSIFISKGSNPPFGGFFNWAWLNIPHFAVFRRPNRWEMMTAFSNAFFVALFISLVYNHVRKERRNSNGSVKLKTRISKHVHVDPFNASAGLLKDLSAGFRKSCRFLGVTVLILILLSGLVSCWFFFYNGLLTYRLSKSYVKPFDWVAQQQGDYKVVTVNKSPGEWANDPNAVTDFAFCRMSTDIGWVHDIGFDSSVIHDKPVLQDGGWEPASKFFLDYLRRDLVEHNMTDDFLKILGSLNYRYVVIPSYSSEKVRDFILAQEGGHVVYNESDSVIVECDHFAQRVFSPRNSAIVVGGSEALMSLYKTDSFNLNDVALVFMNPNEAFNTFSDEEMSSSEALIFSGGADVLDAAIPFMGDSVNLILAKDYAVPSGNVTKYWIVSSFWRDSGKLVLGGDTLTTRGQHKVEIPFSVSATADYEVWMRIAFASDRGKLSLFLDDEFLGELSPKTDYWTTLKWVRIATPNLDVGRHVLSFVNDGSGYNDIDAICLAKKTVFETKLNAFTEKLRSFSGRMIYLLQPEDFLQEASPKWSIISQAYEGHVLLGENAFINISPEATADASSTQFLQEEKINASYVTDGDMKTRWASVPYDDPPQWLELNWANPREIVAAKIYFERAYAEDYLIQTWDSNQSAWITQANVTGNSELVRLHFFDDPVTTTKMRIYVTKFDGFALTSIFELEAYEKSATISSSLSILRNGNYQCFIRANSMLENGRIYVKLGDETSEVFMTNVSSGYGWFDAGTFYVDAGERELSLGSLGKVGISQILLVSLTGDEDHTALGDLFASNKSTPTIEYGIVNPCTYRLQVSATEPFLLVLSETYNPLWKALIENEEISSFPVYSFLNGFFINKTGNLSLTLYFTGQRYVDAGLKVALTSFLVSMVIVLTPSRIPRKIFSKIRQSRKRVDS